MVFVTRALWCAVRFVVEEGNLRYARSYDADTIGTIDDVIDESVVLHRCGASYLIHANPASAVRHHGQDNGPLLAVPILAWLTARDTARRFAVAPIRLFDPNAQFVGVIQLRTCEAKTPEWIRHGPEEALPANVFRRERLKGRGGGTLPRQSELILTLTDRLTRVESMVRRLLTDKSSHFIRGSLWIYFPVELEKELVLAAEHGGRRIAGFLPAGDPVALPSPERGRRAGQKMLIPTRRNSQSIPAIFRRVALRTSSPRMLILHACLRAPTGSARLPFPDGYRGGLGAPVGPRSCPPCRRRIGLAFTNIC